MPILLRPMERFHLSAFEVFLILAALIFTVILIRTDWHSKKRPIVLLSLFLGYAAFQLYRPVDFYPFSAFENRAYAPESSIRFYKIAAVLEDASVLKPEPPSVIPVLGYGRLKGWAPKPIRAQNDADHFASAYARAYTARFGVPQKSFIREVRIEEWRWDFVNSANDPERGFMTKRVTGKTAGSSS